MARRRSEGPIEANRICSHRRILQGGVAQHSQHSALAIQQPRGVKMLPFLGSLTVNGTQTYVDT